MDHEAKLAIFQSQTQNARALKVAMRQVHRSINSALRRGNEPANIAFTKIYAFLFCAWAEANFSKVIHTPYGFDISEIDQIKKAKAHGIREAWKKCLEIGLTHLDAKRGNFLPNARQELERAINNYVYDPSILRNKLAHGQWVVALNRDTTSVQKQTTRKLDTLNLIIVDAWVKSHELLANMVETLIEWPKRAFIRDWYKFVVEIEHQMAEANSHSIIEHSIRLKAKRPPSQTGD
jgi:hypothetical protein